jgi:chaperone protein EcpD
MTVQRYLWASCWLALLLAAAPAEAGVRLGGTRVIYETDKPEATLSVQNTGNWPVLVQAWITPGDDDGPVEATSVPFVMTPPVFRLEPQRSQAIRMKHLAPAEVKGREQVYWLNVYEIPGRARNRSNMNRLEIATRTRIKVFVRPADTKEPVAASADRLAWRLQRDAEGGAKLVVDNPTPYHVSFGEVGLMEGVRRVPRLGGQGRGGMVAPYASQHFPVALSDTDAHRSVYAKVINDHGGIRLLEWPLEP